MKHTVTEIFRHSGVPVFSATEIVGFKTDEPNNMMDNWFSRGPESFDSLVTFSFTEEAKADLVLRMVNEFNVVNKTEFPLRAFVMPVEKFSSSPA
jgi:hypothetical protein